MILAENPKRYSTTADVSRGKAAGKLRRQQGSGLVSMTGEDNELAKRLPAGRCRRKTLFDHGRCIARQGRRQVEASTREWTCVHDRRGQRNLPRDCPRDAAEHLPGYRIFIQKNKIYSLILALRRFLWYITLCVIL